MFSIKHYISIVFSIIIILYILISFKADISDNYIVLWQVISIIIFLFTFHIGKKVNIKHILLLVFIYQILFSYLLFSHYLINLNDSFGYNAVDSKLYSDIAKISRNLTFEDTIKYISLYLDDYSDLGYPIYLKYIYFLGNGDIVVSSSLLIITNCFWQLLTTIITYKLSCKIIGHKKSKYVALLWGLNTCSVFLNSSGLKEPVFSFLCMTTMWYIYKLKYNKNLTNIIFTTLLIISTFFFRYYVSLFFIIIVMGFVIFPYFYNKFFKTFIITSIIICLFLTSLLAIYMPEIYNAINRTQEMYKESGIIYQFMTYILAFISPIPKFFEFKTPQSLIMLTYSIIKFYFSIFGIVAAYQIMKYKRELFYPLITISLFQILLLIVSGRAVDYRYAYITMPCFFILIVEGIYICKNKYIVYSYLLFASLIVIMFNLRDL